MINRYAGEIHINPVRMLRGDDYNNDGRISDIRKTLEQAIQLNQEISDRLKKITDWMKDQPDSSLKFHFAEGGYISIQGLPDSHLKQLEAKGLIELFDFATDKEWVKKNGASFGLIWENGRAVEL
jgi:hypothetical protein